MIPDIIFSSLKNGLGGSSHKPVSLIYFYSGITGLKASFNPFV